MPTPTATAVAYAIELYLLVGLLFAIWFALRGAAKLDPAAANGSWGFRLLLVPQTIVIWPLALIRLAGGRGQG
ncbi:hypothetical protein N8467_00155 [bacterium]|nr:hypothetical protein [bacterium]